MLVRMRTFDDDGTAACPGEWDMVRVKFERTRQAQTNKELWSMHTWRGVRSDGPRPSVRFISAQGRPCTDTGGDLEWERVVRL